MARGFRRRARCGERNRPAHALTAFNDIVGQLSGGKSPAEMLAQMQGMAANNPGAATAMLGGLAAAIFGTSTGRGLATSAAKLGGLAMIGGLAWRAWQNHQQGKPLIDLDASPQVAPPPTGSAFSSEAATNETASLYIRAMIAAAAADGSVDASEQQAIMGGVKAAGFNAEAHDWLADEIARPATVADLVAATAGRKEIAAQVYTAARIAIEPDAAAESAFSATSRAGSGSTRNCARRSTLQQRRRARPPE